MPESKNFIFERHVTDTGELLNWYLYRKIGKDKVLVQSIAEVQELCLLLNRAAKHEHFLARGGDDQRIKKERRSREDRRKFNDPNYQGPERRRSLTGLNGCR